MATTTMVHVRIDERIKVRAEKALKAMGMSVSDAVRVLLTRVATEKALPFAVCVPHAPNAQTIAAMKELERGRGVHSYDTVEQMLADDAKA